VKNGEKMTSDENKKTKDAQENTSKGAKDFGEKTSDAFEKVTEGAKKAGEKAEVAIDNLKEGTKKAGEKAEVVIDNLKEGAKKAGEKANDAFGNILTGMKKVGDKATDAVEILEIKREINRLESANKKIVPQISDAVLTLYNEKIIKNPTLMAFCEEIEKNTKLIEEKKAQIEVIKESETE